jgi:hypothetical protein
MFRKIIQFFHSTHSSTPTPSTVHGDDVYLASYPKSGNAFLSQLICNYTESEDANCFEGLRQHLPDIHMNPEARDEIDRPRFIKSHAAVNDIYPKVVYIVRDGRQITVSYYYYLRRKDTIDADLPFEAFVRQLSKGTVPFGSWHDHVAGWLDRDDVLVVRYEDLLDDTQDELERIIEFAGLEVDSDRAAAAVEASRYEKLKKRQEKRLERGEINPSDAGLRGGKKKDWQDHFSEALHEESLEQNGDILHRLDYL